LNKPWKQNDFFGNEWFFFDENKKNTDW
jgi:hypothetical protein